MAIQDWLLPGENIKYVAPASVSFSGSSWRFLITSERLILYSKKGSLFSKEKVIAERIEDLVSMSYGEHYELFQKRGLLQVRFRDIIRKYSGSPENMKEIWHNLQPYIRRESKS